jgi:hypothetical protein
MCPGVAVVNSAHLRLRDDLAQLGWLRRTATRGVSIPCTTGPRSVVVGCLAAALSRQSWVTS